MTIEAFAPREHLREALDHRARGIIRRRERFVNDQFAIDHRDEIGERPSGVDARDDDRGTFRGRRARFTKPSTEF